MKCSSETRGKGEESKRNEKNGQPKIKKVKIEKQLFHFCHYFGAAEIKHPYLQTYNDQIKERYKNEAAV